MAISKIHVHRFAPDTAEYVVVQALRSASRDRNSSANFSWRKNPDQALEWAKRNAYFPDSESYLEGKIPKDYACGECGAGAVELW